MASSRVLDEAGCEMTPYVPASASVQGRMEINLK
jgi:hypothetical protein